MSRKTELNLLRPRLVPLSAQREREAVALLAELLLDVARKYGAGVCGGVLDGGSDGAIAGVVSLPARAGKARKAA